MSIDLPILDNYICRHAYGARSMRSRVCAGFNWSSDEGGICPVTLQYNLFIIFKLMKYVKRNISKIK